MHITLTYSDIIHAIKCHYSIYDNLELSDIKLEVLWDQDFDLKPNQEDFTATANFKTK